MSFESDTDEEIDTTEIEEKYWVDYMKRSTNEDIEKMGNEKILEQDSQKNEMETGAESCHITE